MSHFFWGGGEEVASNQNDFNIIWGEDTYPIVRPEWYFCLKLSEIHVYSYIPEEGIRFKKNYSPFYQILIQHS